MLRLLYFLILGRDMLPREKAKPPCGFRFPAINSIVQGGTVLKVDTIGVCDARPTPECQDGYCVAHHKRRECTCEP